MEKVPRTGHKIRNPAPQSKEKGRDTITGISASYTVRTTLSDQDLS